MTYEEKAAAYAAMSRDMKVALAAFHYLEELKDKGYLTGGKMRSTPKGREMSEFLVNDTDFECSNEELCAAALSIINQSGGIQRE